MTTDEFKDQTRSRLEKAKVLREKESRLYLDFVKAARQHAFAVRPGDTVLYVESDPTGVNVIKSLLEHVCNRIETDHLKFVQSTTFRDAQRRASDLGQDLKLLVVDLDFGLKQEDGVSLIEWAIQYFNQSLPIVAIANSQSEVSLIRETFPFVEIMLKGETQDNANRKTRRWHHCDSTRVSSLDVEEKA